MVAGQSRASSVSPARQGFDRHELHGLAASRLSGLLPRVTPLSATRPELSAAAKGEGLERLPPDQPATRNCEGEDEKMLDPDRHHSCASTFSRRGYSRSG